MLEPLLQCYNNILNKWWQMSIFLSKLVLFHLFPLKNKIDMTLINRHYTTSHLKMRAARRKFADNIRHRELGMAGEVQRQIFCAQLVCWNDAWIRSRHGTVCCDVMASETIIAHLNIKSRRIPARTATMTSRTRENYFYFDDTAKWCTYLYL